MWWCTIYSFLFSTYTHIYPNVYTLTIIFSLVLSFPSCWSRSHLTLIYCCLSKVSQGQIWTTSKVIIIHFMKPKCLKSEYILNVYVSMSQTIIGALPVSFWLCHSSFFFSLPCLFFSVITPPHFYKYEINKKVVLTTTILSHYNKLSLSQWHWCINLQVYIAF